jgi:hypothetical protein
MIRPFVSLVILSGFLLSIDTGCHSNSSNPVTPPDTTGGFVVRKPNIYIYPQTNQRVDVTLSFPLGGHLLNAIPDYANGWQVTIDPDGTIDGKYRFLFYEAQTPDGYQYSSGWIVSRDSLVPFFTRTLNSAGFSALETVDFLEYWIPLLMTYEYYQVFPQQNAQIDKLIGMNISPRPDAVLRLFFVFQGTTDSTCRFLQPQLSSINRVGYFAVEWGGVLK